MAIIDQPQVKITAVDATKEAFDAVKKRFADLGSTASDLNKSFAGVLAGLSVTGAATGFITMVNGAIVSMDALHKLNLQTGVSVEVLSALSPVAKQAGTDLDTVAGMVNKLQKNMLTFAQTGAGKAADAFTQLGYSQAQVSAGLKNMDAFLPEFAKRLVETGVGGEQAGLAMQLMAKGGATALPFLKQLAEAGTLTARVTTEQAAEAHKFEVSLAKLSAESAKFARGIANDLLPALNEIASAMVNARREGDGFFMALIKGAREASIQMVMPRLGSTLEQLSGVRKEIARVQSMPFVDEGQLRGLRLRESELEKTRNTLVDINKFSKDLAEPKAPPKSLNELPAKTAKTGADKGITFDELLARNALTRMKAIEQAEVDADKAAADWQRTLDGLIGGTLIERTNKMQVSADFLRDAFDAGRISSELYGQALDKLLGVTGGLSEAMRRAGSAADQLISQTSIERAKLMQDTIAELDRRLTAGVISIEQHGEALKMLAEHNKETTEEITEFWKQAARSMQESMGTLFFDVMQGNLSDLGNSFKRTLDRMVADVLAAQAATALFGKDFGKSDKIGGLVGQGLAWLGIGGGGGAYVPTTWTPTASGGPRSAGQPLLVGEQGPELWMPRTAGTMIPNKALGGMSVIVNITTPDIQSFRASKGQIAAQMATALAAANRHQ